MQTETKNLDQRRDRVDEQDRVDRRTYLVGQIANGLLSGETTAGELEYYEGSHSDRIPAILRVATSLADQLLDESM